MHALLRCGCVHEDPCFPWALALANAAQLCIDQKTSPASCIPGPTSTSRCSFCCDALQVGVVVGGVSFHAVSSLPSLMDALSSPPGRVRVLLLRVGVCQRASPAASTVVNRKLRVRSLHPGRGRPLPGASSVLFSAGACPRVDAETAHRLPKRLGGQVPGDSRGGRLGRPSGGWHQCRFRPQCKRQCQPSELRSKP